MSLCSDQRLAEQMDFFINRRGVGDGAGYLAAKSDRILLAQSIDHCLYRSLAHSQHLGRIMIGTELFGAATRQEILQSFENLSLITRLILHLNGSHSFVEQGKRPASIKDLLRRQR